MTEGQANGEVRGDLTSEELTAHLESLFLSSLMIWFVADNEVSLGERLDGMLTLFFDGAGVGDVS